MQGFLLIDKPAGWTSFDVVNYVRKIVAQSEGKKPKQVKVGHAGTLDPFATGLLILLIGKEYTRRAGELSKLAKTYAVTMELGKTSSTGDPEGDLTNVSDRQPTAEELQAVIQQFCGQIEQVPPAYSAVKVNGQRAYKLARAGKEVLIESRQVIINRLELARYDYPTVELLADVSSGTYVRSLVADIGAKLALGAYTKALRRTRVGQFDIAQAVKVKDLASADWPLRQ